MKIRNLIGSLSVTALVAAGAVAPVFAADGYDPVAYFCVNLPTILDDCFYFDGIGSFKHYFYIWVESVSTWNENSRKPVLVFRLLGKKEFCKGLGPFACKK